MTEYENAVATLADKYEKLLVRLPSQVKVNATEISLRRQRCVCVNCGDKVYFLTCDGGLSEITAPNICKPSCAEMEESYLRMCGFSVYSRQEQIARGFITTPSGHRVGIGGSVVTDGNGRATGMTDITSLRVRVAKPRIGCSDAFLHRITDGGRIRSTLFAGPPGCGKTTILRDVAQSLSSGRAPKYFNVAVADERCELAGNGSLISGECCDIVSGIDKREAIARAVRTLRPDVIICDEIGGEAEAEALENASNCGVAVIASIHAGSFEQVEAKGFGGHRSKSGIFENVFLVTGYNDNGYRYSEKRRAVGENVLCAL